MKINYFKNWGARLQIFKKLRGPVCKFFKNWRGGAGPYGRYAYAVNVTIISCLVLTLGQEYEVFEQEVPISTRIKPISTLNNIHSDPTCLNSWSIKLWVITHGPSECVARERRSAHARLCGSNVDLESSINLGLLSCGSNDCLSPLHQLHTLLWWIRWCAHSADRSQHRILDKQVPMRASAAVQFHSALILFALLHTSSSSIPSSPIPLWPNYRCPLGVRFQGRMEYWDKQEKRIEDTQRFSSCVRVGGFNWQNTRVFCQLNGLTNLMFCQLNFLTNVFKTYRVARNEGRIILSRFLSASRQSKEADNSRLL